MLEIFLLLDHMHLLCTEIIRTFAIKKMDSKLEKTRFDTRLTKEQKALFEKAAVLGGYRNLTDFVLMTVQERAEALVKANEQVIASEQDAAIFFEAITNPAPPNEALKDAAEAYNNLLES